MANHKSALKRARQSKDRQARNKAVKTRVKNIVKGVRQTVADGLSEDAGAKLNEAKSVIAKAAKKGVIHKRAASRKISRLARQVNSLSVSA
ncbi:MAG: 30S ribosomal protein S20 [Desulfococcaceae bacterium]|nr:30S ribosomal protein S20 [Desulfococcaceae bacterium]